MVAVTNTFGRSQAPCLIRQSQRFAQTAGRRTSRVNALFDFFNQNSIKTGNKKDQLIEELLRLTEDADAGFAVSSQEREAIAEVVNDLQAYCMKNPLSSEYIFGRWVVRYASKPQTAGGPFKSPVGRLVFPGQTAVQVIAEPDLCINEINFKTLGFIPGGVTQEGTIDPLDGKTFEITFTTNTGKKLGGPPKRLIEILYLDENIRVARAVPTEDNQEPGFYVFTREGVEFVQEDDDVAPAPRAVPRSSTRSTVQVDSGPSRAEVARQEREKLAEQRLMAKEQYAELTAEAKELSMDAQTTTKELMSLEKQSGKLIKEASMARRAIEKAKNIVESVEAQLIESQGKEVSLEKELLGLQRESNKIKQQLLSTKRSMGPKIK